MTHRILLVEDDENVGPLVQARLGQLGYEVVLKADLPDIKILDDYDFSAVISDFQLPTSDGFEVIRFMRDKRPNIPAMMMSGHGDWAAEYCESHGIKGVSYLAKPFKAEQLLDAVNALVLADVMWPILVEDEVSSRDLW